MKSNIDQPIWQCSVLWGGGGGGGGLWCSIASMSETVTVRYRECTVEEWCVYMIHTTRSLKLGDIDGSKFMGSLNTNELQTALCAEL